MHVPRASADTPFVHPSIIRSRLRAYSILARLREQRRRVFRQVLALQHAGPACTPVKSITLIPWSGNTTFLSDIVKLLSSRIGLSWFKVKWNTDRTGQHPLADAVPNSNELSAGLPLCRNVRCIAIFASELICSGQICSRPDKPCSSLHRSAFDDRLDNFLAVLRSTIQGRGATGAAIIALETSSKRNGCLWTVAACRLLH
jgi:hypothetical protein